MAPCIWRLYWSRFGDRYFSLTFSEGSETSVMESVYVETSAVGSVYMVSSSKNRTVFSHITDDYDV